jgi:uncharacterized protein
MQFEREPVTEPNAIVGCDDGEIRLRSATYTRSLIVTRDGVVDAWHPPPLEQLVIGDFAALFERPPDVLLLGTGRGQRMPPPALFAALAARGIGLEAMDNRAACRTYNLLLSEFRNVAVALYL